MKYLGILIDKYLNFSFHTAEVLKKLSRKYSVISQLRHYIEEPVLLQDYFNFFKPVFAYDLLIYVCTSKKTKAIFALQKKILRQICFKSRYYPSADLFDLLKVLNVYD